MRSRALVATLACAGACAADPEPTPRVELEWPVEERGQHRVGFRERNVEYTPFGVEPTRKIRVAVWYPTADTDGDPVEYVGIPAGDDVFAIAKPSGTDLPVMVFSHGNISFAEQSYFLAEHFASHGFIAIAPEHTGNTVSTIGEAVTTEVFSLRPADVAAALDWLYALPERDSLSGRASERVVMTGHSFGGYTTFAVTGARFPIRKSDCDAGTGPARYCSNMTDAEDMRFTAGFLDPRVDVAIPMAPGGADVLGPAGVGQVDVPVLLMTATGDEMTTNARQGDPFWAALDGPHDMRVNLDGGGHHSFAVTCGLLGATLGDGCGDAYTPYEEAHRAIRTYALAFSRRHLFDDASVAPLLDGTTTVTSSVTLTRR